ncbi:MAG: response regulator transcription factor [Clostridiales Family XIII bacterium]|jgi:DNA-binding response OmpR family regulator|nr:response regulator transcription factor [Clostridiales Family XIII bacterium]
MQSILVIEDDRIIRQELKSLLEKYRYRVIAAEDFSDVVSFALAENPHLVLLDINLPFYDGFHICRELRKRSRVPIIVVTSRVGDMDELMSMNLGADYFVSKPYNTQILIARIEALMKRVYDEDSSRLIRFDELTLDMGKSVAGYRGASVELTKNELRILQLLIEGKGDVVSRDDIMEALWQTDTFVDDNTLTVNINRLRRKLGQIGAKELLRTKRGRGYSL